MKKNIIQFAILLVSLVFTTTAFADVKIKSRQTMSGQTSTHRINEREHDYDNAVRFKARFTIDTAIKGLSC